MTPVYKLSANSVKNGRTVYGSMLAGNPVYELPGDFQSIATVSVGSGGAATVSFTSIPATYSHLQVRLLARSGRSVGSSAGLYLQFNSTFLTAAHQLRGNGSSASASGSSGGLGNDTLLICVPGTSAGANIFGAGIVDILDYANTNKNKTVRILSGDDLNGSGAIQVNSGFLNSTSAITSLTFGSVDGVGSIPQYSHFALYGIKGA